MGAWEQTKDKSIVQVIETSITSEEMKILLSREILLKKMTNVPNIKHTNIVLRTSVTSSWAENCKNSQARIPSCNVKVCLIKKKMFFLSFYHRQPVPRMAQMLVVVCVLTAALTNPRPRTPSASVGRLGIKKT